MKRAFLVHLPSVAVLIAVVLLATATVVSPGGGTAAAGVAVLLLAPWGLAAAIGIRSARRGQPREALLTLAVILVAVAAALW